MILKQPLIIPPLEGGDRLSRDEFGRRYQAARHIKKAELIEGVVYVASPVRARSHGEPHGQSKMCPRSFSSVSRDSSFYKKKNC